MSKNYQINNLKNILHGFFLSVATTVAEPSTILPLIVHHFSSNLVLVGLFASLLRGGAIAVQLVAAFYAQSYARVMPLMRRVFLFRFLFWFLIGAAIHFVGDRNPTLTLWLIGIGLFGFSFVAGFGGIYFKEILAKVFTRRERGRTMADRQLASSVGAIISGGIAGWVLQHYQAPENYAVLFMLSAFLMAIGLIAFATIEEPPKERVSQREESFRLFLVNAWGILRRDERLRTQIAASLLGYSFLLAMPFVILHAKQTIHLSGWIVGSFITVQMFGSVLGNFFLWKRFSGRYVRMLQTAYGLMIAAFLLALFANNVWTYGLIFLLFGIGIDGFRNADMNLVLEIAPEEKRPVYVAIQSTIVSVGLFFSIPGGFILEYFGYTFLYILTILMLAGGLYFVHRLEEFVTE
ncbi:MFS transporter [Nitratifractor salsuginis]|uniref:Major facilitator superfamily MFS_1 n=1 Tax=Nitratifractor salsuginis (strain DSM 16511 / JCM 12458 / E9I37-1) TaxID=749222 RepID=E6X146_NITSE|nr:MFS transporter [Nitratifractor salsuginis]ADV45849.1 major facilitator superfamily MFS_1 [Nitratifractor salsuginis DSM 16511]